jgi:hypothetical protein
MHLIGKERSVTMPQFVEKPKRSKRKSIARKSTVRVQLRRLSPRRQVVRDGRVRWEDIAQHGASDAEYTLRLLKTVRNNLFHGGKYPDGPIDEIARNREILRAALTILDGCYELHAGVRRRIDEAASAAA